MLRARPFDLCSGNGLRQGFPSAGRRQRRTTLATPEQLRDGWDKFAAGYDEAVTPFGMRVADDALGRIKVGSGMRFLDVAAGGGALSIPAARRGAKVLATDFSPVMVDRIRERARLEGLQDLDAKVMDGQALELADNTFDIVGSQMGIMMFPNRQRGFAELYRVAKPGGIAIVVVFGPIDAVEGFFLVFQAVQNSVPGFRPPSNSPLFSLGNPDRLRSEMAESGFREIRVETVDHGLEVESASHLWNLLASATPPIGELAAKLSAQHVAAVESPLDEILRQRAGAVPAVLSMRFHIGIGTK